MTYLLIVILVDRITYKYIETLKHLFITDLYNLIKLKYSGTVEICSPYPEFVLTGALSIENALNKKVFVLTGISY